MFEFLKNAKLVGKRTDDINGEEHLVYQDEKGNFYDYPTKLEGAEILSETDKRMHVRRKDGVMCLVSKDRLITETELGDWVQIDKDCSEEEVAKAKEEVIEKVCNKLRQLAKDIPDMPFIVKTSPENYDTQEDGKDIMTIGCRIIVAVPFATEEPKVIPLIVGGKDD